MEVLLQDPSSFLSGIRTLACQHIPEPVEVMNKIRSTPALGTLLLAIFWIAAVEWPMSVAAQTHFVAQNLCETNGSPEPGDWQTESGVCSDITVDVQRGRRRGVIDAVGCLVGIPDKILLWDRRAKNHDVSDATVNEVVHYLNYRGLGDVTVRVNQYAPFKEWRRLVRNRRVGAPWRFSVGLLKHLKYTFLPGRIFGRDQYNPYTNTLYLYSDMPSLGLAEAAYAHDVRQRSLPGTYATVQMIPPVALWHESIATDEVLYYVAVAGSAEQQEKIRHDLYARYGMQLGGEAAAVLPDGSFLYTVAGSIVGHATATLHDFVEQP